MEKLDLLGRMYLIEHCIYVYNENLKRRAYEVYVTDRLKAINESLASFFGGSTPNSRYYDFLERTEHPRAEETRTAEQVISDISDKLEKLGNGSVQTSSETDA